MKSLPFVTKLGINKVLICLVVLALGKVTLLMTWDNEGHSPHHDPFNEPAYNQVATVAVAQAQEKPSSPEPATAPQAPDPAFAESWAKLKERETALEKQEQDLKLLERELKTKLAKLQDLENKIQTMLNEAKVLKDKKLKHLVDVYSNMKAKQAAQVLETLDQKTAVKILAGMKGRTAGEILTYVNAQKAAVLSRELTKLQIPFD